MEGLYLNGDSILNSRTKGRSPVSEVALLVKGVLSSGRNYSETIGRDE